MKLALWNLMKYSSVKAAMFQEAQEVQGSKARKFFKVATTCWLPHGKASALSASCFQAVINLLDASLAHENDQTLDGIRK